ncbi:MAG: hypothetical protein J5678_02450 [Bacteroidaceae bacterium]|nr:hypothetical protein [Bacteroidaceae bacterium]
MKKSSTMSSARRYTLQDIRRRKAEVARQIAAERTSIQHSFRQLTDPTALMPQLLPWRSFKTAFRFASRAVYAYKMVSSVVSLFRRSRR